MGPKISIIVPVYNVEKYVERCLQSCVSQTYRNFEVIAVDDFSTDGSRAILSKMEKEHNFLHCYFQNENKGVSATRNLGIAMAQGDYILFVDGDDKISTDILEKLVEVLNTNAEIDTINFGYSSINSEDEIISRGHNPETLTQGGVLHNLI